MNITDIGPVWKRIVSEEWLGRWDNFENAIASDLRILFLITICWAPTLYVNPSLRRPCMLILTVVFVLRVLIHIAKLLSAHMVAGREAADWARRNNASRRDRILMWLFPGSLMEAWRKEGLQARKDAS